MSDLSRRDAIRVLGAAAGAVGITALPDSWEKATIEAANLPRAAAASNPPTATATPSPTATVTPSPTATVTPSPTSTPTPSGPPPTVNIESPTDGQDYGDDVGNVTISGWATPGSSVYWILSGVPGDGGGDADGDPTTADLTTGDWSVTVRAWWVEDDLAWRPLNVWAEKNGQSSGWVNILFKHRNTI